MSASFDNDITVNLSKNAQAVARQSFGLIAHATEDVGAGFTEKYRLYESNNAAQLDPDLDAAAKSAVAFFFSQPLRPSKVMVAKVAYATLAVDLTALLADFSDWYALDLSSRVKADLIAGAAWAAANDRLLMVQSSDADILTDAAGNVFETIDDLNNGWTGGLYHATDTASAALSWLAAGLSADPDQKAAVWYDRTLTGVVPDVLDDTEKANVIANNGNAYLTKGRVGATGDGKLFDADWLDTRLSRDWAKARIREGIAQLQLDLANRNEKIPYDNNGLAMLESVVKTVLERGVAIGHFRAGSVIVTVPDIADVDPAEILARHATIEAQATLTGGIKTVTINLGILAA